jgi:sensor histidine kinase regulating citrate/malate metabolism
MPFLLINPLSFDLLLQCACDNSVEAMSYKQTDKLIIFDAIIDKDKLTFIIEDNGSGINPDIISQILNVSGFSTKRTGSGLGFQLIQKAADEHKAEIVIDSDPGSYTKLQFIFKLKGEDRATQ